MSASLAGTRGLLAAVVLLLTAACASIRQQPAPQPRPPAPQPAPRVPLVTRTVRVVATAYNATRAQTDRHPHLGAWGDDLRDGDRVIAVSHDLLRLGLAPGTRVRIDGLAGEWQVLDRMPRSRRRAIDVFMGSDIAAAKRFGKKRVTLRWEVPASETDRAAAGDRTPSD